MCRQSQIYRPGDERSTGWDELMTPAQHRARAAQLCAQETARAVEITEGHELAVRAIEIRDARAQTTGYVFVVSSQR